MNEEHDSGAWPVLNCAFHEPLATASGAEHLVRLLGSLGSVDALYVGVSLRNSAMRFSDSDRQHRQILQAVVAGNREAAAELTRKHLRSTLTLCDMSLGATHTA